MPVARAVYRKLRPHSGSDSYKEISSRSNDELMAIVRHEAHRIEKSMYNDIFESKRQDYVAKRDRVEECFALLKERGFDIETEPTLIWAREIVDSFDDLGGFIDRNSRPAAAYAPDEAAPFVEFVRGRRSCRVWSDNQPTGEELQAIAAKMIDAARWAPTSGNRQPWRFVTISDPEKKELLRGIKEQHCISGPLLIWVVMDRRIYGALNRDECSLFIDAGAAIMQMVLTAHRCGLGVCWNHFADDMIRSRSSNLPIYKRFAEAMGIDDRYASIAILAIGRPEYIPPEPARIDIEDLLLSEH